MDLHCDDHIPEGADRVWTGLSDEKRRIPGRTKGEYLCFAFDLMGTWSGHYRDIL